MLPKSGSGGSKPRMGLIKVPLSLKMSFQTTSKNDGLRLVVTFSFLNYILRKLKIFPVQRELHLFSTKLCDARCRDLIYHSQRTGHDGGDQQQRNRQTQNVKNSILLFHLLATSFLGEPNFLGRPIRSSRTTQQFMIRMA